MALAICPRTRASSSLSMRLLVDAKAGRVLYAEAGKDVVDLLLSFLTLPLATVVKLLSADAMPGCVANLYGSVERLDAAYVRSADARAALLVPAGGYETGRLLQLQAAAAAVPAPAAVEVYQCGKGGTGDCYGYVAAVRSTPCRHCRGAMNEPIELVGSSGGGETETAAASVSDLAGTGFVKEVVMYTVMDDLQVAPMSTISSIAALNALGITDISLLQEKSVRLGYNEVRSIFLSKKKRFQLIRVLDFN